MEMERLMEGDNFRSGRAPICPRGLSLVLSCLVLVLRPQFTVAGEDRPRLTLSENGALLEEAGKKPRLFRSLAEIVRSLPRGQGGICCGYGGQC